MPIKSFLDYLLIEKKYSKHTITAYKKDLNDFFTFEVPGFKYMPAYKNKMWDGRFSKPSDKLMEQFNNSLSLTPNRIQVT